MKRLITILLCLLCTLTMMGEQHLMFRTLPIDGDLKTAVYRTNGVTNDKY